MASDNAPNVLRAICAALAFLAPLFALVLLVLAVSHPPAHAQIESRNRRRLRIKVLGAYLAIGSLAILCALAGALGLSTVLGSAGDGSLGIRGRAEVTVEALVFLELGASVIYLTNESIVNGMKAYWALALVIELLCATIISLIYPPVSEGRVSPFIAPALCLLFTVSTIPVLLTALRAHTYKQSPNIAQTSPMTEFRTPSFSGTRLSVQSSVLPGFTCSSSSGPSPSSGDQEKVLTPKSSVSELTAVNHYQHPGPRNAGANFANASTLESGAHSNPGDETLGSRIASSRSKSLLVFLIASQLAAFLAFLLEIVAVKVGLAPALGSDPSPSAYAILHIVRTAFKVLCITAIMAAFLLHAYNAYLRAGSTGQSTTDHPILPPTVDLSRMNAITVSLSTPPTHSLHLTPTKKRPTGRASSVLEKASKKLSFKGRFADKVGNTRVVISGLAAVENGPYASKDAQCHGRKSMPKEPLSRHSSSASYSSSFACPLARKVPYQSMLMSPEATVDVSVPRLAARDSKLDEDEGGEPGYAYIYTDSNEDPTSHMDPLDVGRPAPFRSHQPFSAQDNTRSDSNLTDQAVENSSRSTAPASPVLSFPAAPIDIPASKFSNPYPTPRSTPTATALTERSSSPDVPTSPTPSPQSSRSFRSATNDRMIPFYESPSSSSSERIRRDSDRSFCSSSTQMPPRASSPTPTPTRAPTPGLGFTPFLGSYVRKRESTSSKCRTRPPSPSALLANLRKGKARTLPSKHESISESLAQSFEGIRNGLGGSNGKTKYPLRSSTSQSSLGLGLGIGSGFKFPTLSRRASEIGKGSRNGSSLSLAETAEKPAEGDFMDLRDPFACPNFMHEGKVRIVSQVKGGRESRTGYREDDLFEPEGDDLGSLPASLGRKSGRMSAWGKLPSPPSASSSGPSTPSSTRYYQYPRSPAPTPTKTPVKSKRRGEKKGKLKDGSCKAESSQSGESVGSESSCRELRRCSEDIDVDFLCEEALVAQQLLMKLVEKESAANEAYSQC